MVKYITPKNVEKVFRNGTGDRKNSEEGKKTSYVGYICRQTDRINGCKNGINACKKSQQQSFSANKGMT